MDQRLDDSPGIVHVGDRQFLCSPMRFTHFAQAKRHLSSLRRTPLDELLQRIDQIPEANRERLLDQAYKDTAKSFDPTDTQVTDFMYSLEGFCFCCFVTARDYDPSLRIEHVEEAFNAMSDNESIKRMVSDMQREVYQEDPMGPTQPAPAESRRKLKESRRKQTGSRSTSKSSRRRTTR